METPSRVQYDAVATDANAPILHFGHILTVSGVITV